MSAEATAYVWKYSPYTGVAFTIHLAIADVVNDAHGNRFWSHASTVAMKARTNRTTVSKWMNQMYHDGYLLPLDLGSVDARKARHLGREVEFLMPMPASGASAYEASDHLSESDVATADVGTHDIAMSQQPTSDVATADIQETQERTQEGTQVFSSSELDNSPGTDLEISPYSSSSSLEAGFNPEGLGLRAKANILLAAWVEATGRNAKIVKLSNSRANAVKYRLDEGYPFEMLLDAVRGVALSSWHMGDNPSGKRYDDMELVLRNGQNVEKFSDLYRAGGEQPKGDVVDQVMAKLRRQYEETGVMPE